MVASAFCSAMMSTCTKLVPGVPAMEKTVRQLKALENPPEVMVGGAVVTDEYARSIGADYYAKDVRDAVKIVSRVFSV